MADAARSLVAGPVTTPLRGSLRPPGDKSISHRALILSTLAGGRSTIDGLLAANDVEATAQACRQLGASISVVNGQVQVEGLGQTGLAAPSGRLDMGNSGTAMRLLAGVLSAQPFDSTLTGDDSLQRRPMGRIAIPLRQMGALIQTMPDGCAPLEIKGVQELSGIRYNSPVASAQVKSCVLLAGLFARGDTTVIEPARSRDHTEILLRAFGAVMPGDATVRGGTKLSATAVRVPGDISSAAFFLAAGAMVPGSEIRMDDIGLNPTRAGVIAALSSMNCDIRMSERRSFGGEPVGSIEVRWRPGIRAIDLDPAMVPSLIDELPVLMVVAALAEGVTRIRGARELRIKESDRIAVMATGLEALGFRVRQYPDGIDIEGQPKVADRLVSGTGEDSGGSLRVDAAGDHRCAMSFCVLAQALNRSVRIDGTAQIDTSYPGFAADLCALGGKVAIGQERAHA
jgi:3-phosphoshikimate 1-carboxyvinyltransferase